MSERQLPSPIRQLLREQEPETRLQPIWRRIAQRRSRTPDKPRVARAAALVVALVAVVIAFGLWRRRPPEQRLQVHFPVIPAEIIADTKPSLQDLGDGANVSVARNTRLEVLRQSSTEMLMALRRGNAHFDIRPGGARAWVIECGGASVEVVGTQFTLDRNEQRLSVNVQRGRVLVRGEIVPDTVQSLTAGQALTIPYAENRQVPPESSALPQTVSEHSGTLAGRVPPRQENADWRSAAQQKDWQRAWQSLGEDGVSREASRSDDVSDLLALADVARLSGHPKQAVLPLRQVMSIHAGDARAAIAAFALGKIELDQLGAPVAAATAFERALSLKLPVSLGEDTLARLVEAYARAHDSARARAAAERYRAQFPNGHRTADVDRWSGNE
jgi:transmembrane sensor